MNHDQLFVHLAALLLTGALAAQSIVSPVHFAATEGNASTFAVLGSNATPDHQLQIHGDLVGTGPRTINRLSFRRDGFNRTSYSGFTAIVDVWMSNAITTPGAPSATWANNHGPNLTKVADQIRVDVPPSTWNSMPGPFEFTIQFTRPFFYDALTPLCWEIVVTQRTNSFGIPCDVAQASHVNPLAAGALIGTGCTASGYSVPARLTATTASRWTTNPPQLGFTYNAANLPRSSNAALSFGTSATSFNGIPLPFLLPGTDCSLYNNILTVQPLLTQADGTASRTYWFPANPSLNGSNLFAQVLALDPSANALGIITTNAVQYNIVAPFSLVQVGTVRQLGFGSVSVYPNAGTIVNFN